MSEDGPYVSSEAVSARYEAVRGRLPTASFAGAPRAMADLGEAAAGYDGLALDAYGVLNVGGRAIPGAPERMAALRARGLRLCVLSNAASYTPAGALATYRRLGFDFAPHELVTSREVAASRIAAEAPGAVWAAIAEAEDDRADLPFETLDAVADPGALDAADGVLFLAVARYDAALHARLGAALERRPRPLAVANPDLASPREGGLVREPGWFAHDLADRIGADIRWYGKPYGDGFADVLARLDLPAERVAMVGDTLHTDVLGGRAAGMGTVLVTGHGLFAGADPDGDAARAIRASGIVPDVVVPTT